jgi:hypothetical protein
VSVFLFCVGPALPVPQLLEHETKAKCDKAKAAPASTSGTLGPSTTGHGPGMPIDVDGPADATTAALAAALDAALAAAAATQHSGNSGADSKRKRRELGPAVELPGVPPATSPGAAPTAPPNAPPRKKNASGEHVLEALQASMGDLTERCAVLERERAEIYIGTPGCSRRSGTCARTKRRLLRGSQPSTSARSSRLLTGETKPHGTLL